MRGSTWKNSGKLIERVNVLIPVQEVKRVTEKERLKSLLQVYFNGLKTGQGNSKVTVGTTVRKQSADIDKNVKNKIIYIIAREGGVFKC